MDTPAGHHVIHADPSVREAHLELIDAEFKGWDGSDTVRIIEIPGNVAPLMCRIYGPTSGDDAITEEQVTYTYIRSCGRSGHLRMIDRAPRPVMSMVVIAESNQGVTAVAVYGGSVAAPTEWWALKIPAEAMTSATFWSVHALSSHT